VLCVKFLDNYSSVSSISIDQVFVVTAAQIEEVKKYSGTGSVDQDVAYEPSDNLT
jgi:hypothetical protein